MHRSEVIDTNWFIEGDCVIVTVDQHMVGSHQMQE